MIKVSSCITFFGNCKKAVDFYMQVFDVTNVKVTTFEDKSEIFKFDLPEKCKDLIYRAELNIINNCNIFSVIMSDSPILAFNTDINGNSNNRDNISYEIYSNDKVWIIKTYNEFLKEGKRNTPLQKRDEYELTGSVMDKFGVCWILNYSE